MQLDVPRYGADRFSGDTAAECAAKASFLNALVRFVASDFSYARWCRQRRLYLGLSQHLGHIAHYDSRGFYGEWFESTKARVRFVRHHIENQVYGNWADVNRWFVSWLQVNRVLAQLQAQLGPQAPVNNSPIDFCVAAISSNRGSFGHSQCVLFSKDGQAWKVLHIQGGGHRVWQVGDVLNVSRRDGEPEWGKLGVECPERMSTDPPGSVVAEVWSQARVPVEVEHDVAS